MLMNVLPRQYCPRVDEGQSSCRWWYGLVSAQCKLSSWTACLYMTFDATNLSLVRAGTLAIPRPVDERHVRGIRRVGERD